MIKVNELNNTKSGNSDDIRENSLSENSTENAVNPTQDLDSSFMNSVMQFMLFRQQSSKISLEEKIHHKYKREDN